MKKEDINANEEETFCKKTENESPSPESGQAGSEENTVKSENSCEENASAESEGKEEKDPLDIALAQIEELKTQALYRQAEFENFRKRTVSEKTDLILNGGQNVIKAILPVLDDMERAIDNASKAESIDKLEEGWELIAKKLTKALKDLGVEKIDTKDADFNTDFHEAIALVPGMGDDKKGKVIDCVQAGYTMNGKVIRHAKVAVGQ